MKGVLGLAMIEACAQGGFTTLFPLGTIPSCVWEKRKSSLQKEGWIYVKVGMNVHSGKTIPFAMREGISQMLLVVALWFIGNFVGGRVE